MDDFFYRAVLCVRRKIMFNVVPRISCSCTGEFDEGVVAEQSNDASLHLLPGPL